MSDVLFTGFPGFIGMRLLPRILERQPHARVACLVQDRFAAVAQSSLEALEAAHPHTRGRLELVLGDITLPGLGIEVARAKALQASLRQAWHLAAVYDLAVARPLAQRVNVEGTRNLLEFAGAALAQSSLRPPGRLGAVRPPRPGAPLRGRPYGG
ncbi:MAG TPA: SDR family oxidoreductase [Planctomycetota bacterium]|nr:SDR family oxidoreductase [Planctomycetota bacterium]